MSQIPVTTQKELVWKFKDGTTKPLSELTKEELKLFGKISFNKGTIHYKNYEFWNQMLTQIDSEVHNRLIKAEEEVKELKQIEQEI